MIKYDSLAAQLEQEAEIEKADTLPSIPCGLAFQCEHCDEYASFQIEVSTPGYSTVVLHVVCVDHLSNYVKAGQDVIVRGC